MKHFEHHTTSTTTFTVHNTNHIYYLLAITRPKFTQGPPLSKIQYTELGDQILTTPYMILAMRNMSRQ